MPSPEGSQADAKKKTLVAAEQDRPDVRKKRQLWRSSQSTLNLSRLVFLDETWAKTNMTRLRGRSLRGTRLIAKVPHGHWKTTTFVAGLRAEGWVAPTVIDGAINGDLFVAYVEQQLCPALRPGDIVVLDNLSSHKRAEARDAIEKVGAEMLFLPPYSPDLNPIEQAFAKLKALLRRSGRRTMESLWSYCGKILDEFTPAEFINYIRHSGYRYA